jgi:hypothetical protein
VADSCEHDNGPSGYIKKRRGLYWPIWGTPSLQNTKLPPIPSKSFGNGSDCTGYEGKGVPLEAWSGPEGYRSLRLPEFLHSRHMKVVRLSALRTGSLYPPGNISGTHLC